MPSVTDCCPPSDDPGAPAGRRRAGPPPGAGRLVFIVTALGCLHGLARSVDRERGLPRPRTLVPARLPGLAGLGHHRLQHRVRLAARHRRPQRRPTRAPAAVLHRSGRLHPGFGPVRPGPLGGPARRRPVHPGQRGGRHAAGLARPPARAPSPASGAPRWWPCGVASAPWPWPPGPRSAVSSSPDRAGGGCSSSTCPSVPSATWWAGGS